MSNNRKEIKQTQKWDTKRIKELNELVEDGYEIPNNNPFWDGNSEFKLGNIVFEYTEEELEELKKCKSDVIYFANHHCNVMTDNGIERIELRDYQEDVLKAYQNNRFSIFLAPRQIGKCHLPFTYIAIELNNKIDIIPVYEIYFKSLKKQRKLKISEHIKYFFCKLYTLLSKHHMYTELSKNIENAKEKI